MRGTEIAQNVFLGVAPLLGADDHDLVLAQMGKAADHGAVLGKKPVAMQFVEIGESGAQVIEGERALGMAGQLDPLPGGEVGKNLPARFRDLRLNFLISSSKLTPSEWASGCFFSSSSLLCNSKIGFSKSS